MLAGVGPRAAGRLGYDPATRRRVRRTSARLRPLLLPVSVLLGAVLVLGARAPQAVAPLAPTVVEVPEGHVLVAVRPDDPAVLALAVPGRRIDVYAGMPFGAVPYGAMSDGALPSGTMSDGAPDPSGGSTDVAATLVVRDALVVAPPSTAGSSTAVDTSLDPSAAAAGGLLPTGPEATDALALVVTDQEAAALAARPDVALLIAVRGPP